MKRENKILIVVSSLAILLIVGFFFGKKIISEEILKRDEMIDMLQSHNVEIHQDFEVLEGKLKDADEAQKDSNEKQRLADLKVEEMKSTMSNMALQIEAIEHDKKNIYAAKKNLEKENKELEIERKKYLDLSTNLASRIKKLEEVKSVPKQVSRSTKKESGTWRNFNSTAYVSFCDTGCTGVTATGKNVKNDITHDGMRIIAVDPSVIPLYSIVQLNIDGNLEYAIALDTGGAIKGFKIDYLVAARDTKKAFNYGTKNIQLRIVRSGKGA